MGAFRKQLEQPVKSEDQVFAERVRSDEAKEAFRASFAKRKPEYHPQCQMSQATKGDDTVTWIGRVKRKVAPTPLLAVAHNRPPCDSIMVRLMAKPMPLPCGLVVKNAE